MNYMHEQMGAWQIDGDAKQGRVQFKIFFPNEANGLQHHIQSIQVVGNFQDARGQRNWDPGSASYLHRSAHPEGEIWSHTAPEALPGGFYEYKYYVTFNDPAEPPRWVSDPCTRYGGGENMNAAFVIGGSQPADNPISPLKGGRRPLSELVIYEMMIDDFTAEFRGKRAPLDAVRDKLSHLKELGINAILFMPWTAWHDGAFNWGYTPALYYSVEYRYANDLDHPAEKLSWLKKLVSACHEEGLHVIMDGVFNHVYPGFPYKSFYQHYDQDCPYTGTFHGEFPALQDLDFHHHCTQDFVRDICCYWIDEFKIDGIRFDNTVNFYHKYDPRGIPQLLEDIEAHLAQKGEKNFSLTLEHIHSEAAEVTNATRANSYWDDALHHYCFSNLWENRIQPALLNSLNNNRYLQDPAKRPIVYLSNHDHSHVAWRAGARSNDGFKKWYRTQPYITAMLTSPGVPMLQNGEEFAESYWFPENDEGSSRRVQPRPLHWRFLNDKFGQALFKVYARLIHLRNSYPALRNGDFIPDYWEEWQTQFNDDGLGIDTEKQLMIYRRRGHDDAGRLQEFVIALNFSGISQAITVPFPEDGEWVDLLSEPRWYLNIQNQRLDFTISSNWGHIFYKGELQD